MQGLVALVTGGASGIGFAFVRQLLEAGGKVAIVDINKTALSSAKNALAEYPDAVELIELDLTDHAAVKPMVAGVIQRFGRIDILVNSAAAMGGTYDIFEVDASAMARAAHLNVATPLLLIQEFARHVQSRAGGGKIVNVSSGSAFRAQKTRLAYGASKAGLNALTRIAAAQLGALDINVNAVAPGVTDTPSGTVSQSDPAVLKEKLSVGPHANFMQRVSSPEEIAATMLFLCTPGARQITGQVIHVSAGNIV